MTAIWSKSGPKWSLVAPVGFPKEAELHTMVEEAPQLLPLAGSPSLTVLGREVRLGANYADLIAVESTGRAAIIEVKLAYNPEARRAVVAQVLAYAAYLRGLSVETFEGETLKAHLSARGVATVAEAVQAGDQAGAFDASAFAAGLATSLADGAFRLVLVLDEAPSELVRIVGYLESITDALVIDLVTVAAYDINGTTVLVPQRVEPDRLPAPAPKGPGSAPTSQPAYYEPDGGEEFAKAIADLPADKRLACQRLLDWAIGLEKAGIAKVFTYHGPTNVTLLPRIVGDEAGLVKDAQGWRRLVLGTGNARSPVVRCQRRSRRTLAAGPAAPRRGQRCDQGPPIPSARGRAGSPASRHPSCGRRPRASCPRAS